MKNVIKSAIIKNDLNFKTEQKIKARNQRYRHIKNQNTERKKPIFPKEYISLITLNYHIVYELIPFFGSFLGTKHNMDFQ